jgi:hypothetical protein
LKKKKKLHKKDSNDLHRKQNTHIYIAHRWGEKEEEKRKNSIVDNILSKTKCVGETRSENGAIADIC